MALHGESWTGSASCGHTVDLDLAEFAIDRRHSRVRWMQSKGKCRSCFATEREKHFEKSKATWIAEQRAKEAASVEKLELEAELPTLEGSPKQIDFARRVRYQLLSAAHHMLVLEGDLADNDFYDQIEQPAQTITKAGWWLDQRGSEPTDLAELLLAGITDPDNLATCENPA